MGNPEPDYYFCAYCTCYNLSHSLNNHLLLFQFAFSGYSNQLNSPIFTIDDGAQAPVVLAAKDRSVIAATFTKFLLRNIGTGVNKIVTYSEFCELIF